MNDVSSENLLKQVTFKMTELTPYLMWLDDSFKEMSEKLVRFCNLNTGTLNPLGIAALVDLLHKEFCSIADGCQILPALPYRQLGSDGEILVSPLGPNLYCQKRADAPIQVLLAIHTDTVYDENSPFRVVKQLDENTLNGPGVADAKGGIIVMLYALKAFERYVAVSQNRQVGWRVILNSDEEIGSPSSSELFRAEVDHVDFALLFEPATRSGGLVSTRKGSGNFSVRVKGVSAHSGRDFESGRNAIVAAASITTAIHALNGQWPGVTINVAKIDGGGPSNMVPDLGIVRLNIRYECQDIEDVLLDHIRRIIYAVAPLYDVVAELDGSFLSPPKPDSQGLRELLKQLQDCGNQLGFELTIEPSGGACDGNRLAALGLPTVDNLGVRGGDIHSPREFVKLDSLVERAKLTACFLMKMSRGDLSLPTKERT